MQVGILLALGTILPACRIARLTSESWTRGKGRAVLGIVRVSSGISAAAEGFYSRFRAKTSCLSSRDIAS
jgi:hypothetical protein